MADKLRVLVVDDSSFNRRAISEILTSHPDIEVIDTATDGEQALKKLPTLNPDLITLDIEMPRMDGFTFLRLLMSQRPTPVIVVSSHSRKQEVFQALELGALDFIAKPGHYLSADHVELRRELINKALAVRNLQILPLSKLAKSRPETSSAAAAEPRQGPSAQEERSLHRVVCIGASTGGPPALQSIFRAVREAQGTAFLVAQHMPANFTRAFAERLDRHAGIRVKEAEDAEVVRAGWVFVAPGGMHMEIARGVSDVVIRVRAAADGDHYLPSVDRLFVSAARCFGDATMAIVLTGMGNDGAEGVRAVRAAGGATLAESPATAIVYGMPKAAAETDCVDESLPLDEIITRVQGFAGAPLPSGEREDS